MSYPQPDSSAAVAAAQDFFRLNTPLVSAGDIYETVVGGEAFSIGPESDISKFAVDYYDAANGPTFMNTATVGKTRAFLGGITAQPGKSYQPSGSPGRTFIRPLDLYNPTIDPTAVFGVPGDQSFFIAPQLDVIQYFAAPPSLVSTRNDKSFQMQRVLQGAAGTAVVVIPAYGRKRASYQFKNLAATNQSFGIGIMNYFLGDGDATPDGASGNFIVAVTSYAAGAQVDGVINTDTVGTFDAIVVYLVTTGTLKFTCRIDVSDV